MIPWKEAFLKSEDERERKVYGNKQEKVASEASQKWVTKKIPHNTQKKVLSRAYLAFIEPAWNRGGKEKTNNEKLLLLLCVHTVGIEDGWFNGGKISLVKVFNFLI